MTEIKASDVKNLREITGAGMMDCKKALQEANGDQEKAIEALRKMGLKSVTKRAGKVAAEGFIGMYLHAGGQIAAIVELNCETDFVARGDEFQDCAKGIAMHVAAMKPAYLQESDIPEAIIEKEKQLVFDSLKENQKDMAEKITAGKLRKFYEDNCLVHQPYVKDDSGKLTIAQLVENLSAKVGEKVTVRRFAVFEVGEGIEKEVTDLAAEVQATLAGV